MKLRYRAKTFFKYVALAFYPKTTLLTCIAAAIVIGVAIVVALLNVERGTVAYDFLLAILTGAIASLFVAVVVELTGNYRHNKLALHELDDYYLAVVRFDGQKRIYMRGLGAGIDEDGASDGDDMLGEVDAVDEIDEPDEDDEFDEDDAPKDAIQSTWELLPTLEPLLSETLAQKKAYLTEHEIFCLKQIEFSYRTIRNEVAQRINIPLLYNTLNHPDERFLESRYPKNVLDDMPDWIRKHIASSECKRAADEAVDAIMTDRFMLPYFMRDYEVSERVVNEYDFDSDKERRDQFIDSRSHPEDPGYWDDDVDEETFRARREEMRLLLEEAHKPFSSWLISTCCKDISECMDELVKEAAKKPYYDLLLDRKRD